VYQSADLLNPKFMSCQCARLDISSDKSYDVLDTRELSLELFEIGTPHKFYAVVERALLVLDDPIVYEIRHLP